MFIVDEFARWAKANGRKLMVLLSFDVPQVREYLTEGTRFDEAFLAHLKRGKFTYVDMLPKAKDEFANFKVPVDKFLARFYVARAGAQVFGHYNPYGNFWFANGIRQELVDWMTPKPVSYR